MARIGGIAVVPADEMIASVGRCLNTSSRVAAGRLLEDGDIAHECIVGRYIQIERSCLDKIDKVVPMAGNIITKQGTTRNKNRDGRGG